MIPMVRQAIPSRPTRSLHRLAPAVALAVAMGAAGPVRAAAPQGDFEQLIARADEHAGQGRHAEALQAYADALAVMPSDLKASGVGELVAVGAGDAGLADFRARGDRKSLEAARTVLTAFIAAAKGADPATGPGSTTEAEQRLAEIDALMPAPVEAPTESPPTSDEAEPPSPGSGPADAAPDRSRLGLGLAVSGGVVALAGVGLVVAGLRQVPWYEGKLEAEGWLPSDAGYDQEIANAERVRNLDVGLGVAALLVGTGLGIAGGVLMAKSKRGQGTMAVAPQLGRDRAMVAATLRF